ncbi:transcription factor WER-like [Vitis riparia]|uniref:transcription factor WER-like n=1 Tax=Vitis riparia TaxID=96939 RepID=UPI00155ABEBD|nr:transcription factor WER-like [Vitis riparia]
MRLQGLNLLFNYSLLFNGEGFPEKSMMARLRKQRRPWTKEEDQKLIDCISSNGHLSWPDIAMQAGLERSGKSCRERWNNCVSPHVKRGNFSQEEDDTIIRLQCVHGNRWAYIATQLPGRSEPLEQRWNNYLKKKPAISTLQNISDTQLFHLNQNIPNASSIPTPISALQEIANPWFTSDEANQEFLRDDEIIHHSLIAEFTSFIPNVNPNETNFGGDYFEPWISGPASASVEYALMPTERITTNWSPLFEAWPELTD